MVNVKLDDDPDLQARDIAALRESAGRASAFMKQLANEQRLQILCRLLQGECSVSSLANHLDLAQSATSQHLAKMREYGLLSTRRDAQNIFYRISDERVLQVMKVLCDVFATK